MDRRGGCCIARYGGGGGVYDTSKMDRIMLRFRPIAPKPVGGSVCGGSTPEISEKCRRGKRRNVKDKRCNNKKRKASSSSPPEEKKKSGVTAAVTTLSLLPESPEPRDSPEERSSTTWLSFESFPGNKEYQTVNIPAVRPVRVVGSSVTVDCVTDTWVDGGLGFTDEERRMSLETDTCPGFLSDGYGRVVWTNGAYKSMVGQENETDEVTVCLVVKETASVTAVALAYPAFTCRVRVQYTCGSLTVPCDVWRMEGGGFAWRLDVKAALCLGRP
ncbi:PREDICTED: uncharacterized protein LOC101315042 [Fragaria vesca subsp. vesca]|uniref:uncharacterized protein LOC101315042 n=1 Tax=Fragaria vesca subsp. vesca TaxID=101020 RepID=UPI0002C3424E|nr:PREDICTED: uncharacterized protein LOC101315042 [Fragaria vesca subsp. vesca]